MARQRLSISALGQLQRTVMEHIWNDGEASVNQLRDRINTERAGKSLAYTTILSVLQKLEAAGWVTHRAEGRTYLYRARQSREQASAASVKAFVSQIFGGNPLSMFQHLLEAEELTAQELAELRKMIDQHRKKSKP